MRTKLLDAFATANHGLVTRDAACRAGFSPATWYRALAGGELEPMYQNVARLYGSPDSRGQRIAAAVLAAQPGAIASHRSAAYLWGIPRPESDPVDIVLTRRTRGLTLGDVILHRPRDRKDLSPVLRRNIRTSNILRLLCDLGAVDPAGVSAAVGFVVTTRLASPYALRRAIEVHARRGRHGVPAFRDALEEWLISGQPIDSVLERSMHRLLKRYRLPAAEFHAHIAGYEVDFWITGTRLVLECDGWDFHGRTRHQFERDTDRNSTLIAAGFLPVHFCYCEITERPTVVVKRIRDALAQFPAAA